MLARAAAPNERGSVKYNNCAKSDINKKLHDAIPYFKKKKNSYCESTQKKWLWKEFDTTARRGERSKSGFRVMLTRVSYSARLE